MKKFLKTILLILSVLLIINCVLDYVFSRHLCHSKSELYKEWNSIMQDSIDADLLIMGSSRACGQYDPHILDSILGINSYNIGMIGNGIVRQIVKYKVYRHYQKKTPSFLIVNFDYWGTFIIGAAQPEQYYPYLTNKYMGKYILREHLISTRYLCIPMYRYYDQGICLLLQEARKTDNSTYKGYCAYNWKWDGRKLAETEDLEFVPNQHGTDRFDSFLEELKKEGENVIFVSSPIYKGLTKITTNLSEFYDYRQYFSEKYNIPVLDYINDPICNDTTYFYNATHMNKVGAELFTTKLCHDIDSLGLLKCN